MSFRVPAVVVKVNSVACSVKNSFSAMSLINVGSDNATAVNIPIGNIEIIINTLIINANVLFEFFLISLIFSPPLFLN